MTRVIDVVAAVVRSGDAYLVTRRPDGVHLGGLWEFPGGKVSEGETLEDALRREIREELDTEVDVFERILEVSHAYPDRTVRLHFYRCALLGIPRALVAQEMRWVPGADLSTLGFPPADEDLIRLLTTSASS
jgi:mutator protein MutT